jgi:hypothetical protein
MTAIIFVCSVFVCSVFARILIHRVGIIVIDSDIILIRGFVIEVDDDRIFVDQTIIVGLIYTVHHRIVTGHFSRIIAVYIGTIVGSRASIDNFADIIADSNFGIV